MPESIRVTVSCFRLLVLVFGFQLIYLTANAQKPDSAKAAPKLTAKENDSVKAAKRKLHSPTKAVIFSAILPGLGQAYNHKYWKIPIIYVGLGVATYFIITNQQQYNIYQAALKDPTNPLNNLYSPTDITTIRDYYLRYLDLSIIGAAVMYVLNVIDAEVDAQFFTFNVSDDISVRMAPQLNTSYAFGKTDVQPGLSFVLKLNKKPRPSLPGL